jgi:medium-chain acyl-[acyl-carrier-protein] hydrolase
MGATVVFELARFLRERAGLVPVCLFVSGRRAPQLPPQRSPIHHLPEEQFVEELLRFNGTPSMVLEHKELRELFLPILRADFAIHETYEYLAGEPFECPIFAFGGSEDELVDWKDLTAWEAQTKGPFSARLFVGDHFFLRSASEPVLQSITQALVSTLN